MQSNSNLPLRILVTVIVMALILLGLLCLILLV